MEISLDPCDGPAVFDFLQGKHTGKENSVARQAVQRLLKAKPMFSLPQMQDQRAKVVNRLLEKS